MDEINFEKCFKIAFVYFLGMEVIKKCETESEKEKILKVIEIGEKIIWKD